MNEFLAKDLVIQDELHAARNIENVFRIHQYGSIVEDFRQRRRIRGDNWRAVCHRFQWRQAETLVQGWKGEQRRRLIKNAQYGIRDETEEANILLRTAANDGQSKILVLAEFVTDDEQLQILVLVIINKLALQDGKRLDQPVKVFVGPYLARVQHKRIFKLISL